MSSHSFNAPGRSYSQVALFIVALILFGYGLWGVQDYIGFNSRFALFVIEMLRDGPSFFPTTYGEPYPDYPATSTVLIWLLARLTQTFNYLIAVAPSAVASAITLVLLYRLLAAHSRQWAWLAVGFVLLTPQYLTEARMISLDQIVATITMGAFYLAYQADRQNRPGLLGWALLVTLVGFAFRGPIGLVLPTGAITGYFLVAQRWRWLILYGCSALVLLVLCIIAWLGAAWLEGERLFGPGYGREFIAKVIHWQVGLRLSPEAGDSSHFYYLQRSWSSYALSFPLGMLTLLGLLLSLRRPVAHPQWRYLCWGFAAFSLVILLGMSVPTGKKMRYLLPMVPGFAALAAYPLVAGEKGLLNVLGRSYRILLLLFPGLCTLLLTVALVVGRQKASLLGLELAPWLPTVYGLIAATAVMQCALLWLRWRGRQPLLLSVLLSVLSLWLVMVLLVEPVQRADRNTSHFTAVAEQIRAREPAPLGFYRMGKDAMAIKYMVNLPYPLQPQFFYSAAELQKVDHTLWLVGEERDLQPLLAQFGSRIQVALTSVQFDGKAFALYRFCVTEQCR
ncbi:MAG: ArnT family glycosyltransferase [Enterobacteriaceae bacterium]